jgi:hypothetical protein
MRNLLAATALALAFSPAASADTTLDYDVLHRPSCCATAAGGT